jgi:integrase
MTAEVKKLSVKDYLDKLRMAKKSPQTIKGYAKVFKSFSEATGIPCDDLHLHLSADKLAKYAFDRIEAGKSAAGTQTNIRILSRFYKLNGIVIDGLDLEIIKNPGEQTGDEEEDDGGKALTLDMLQKMQDKGTEHSRSLLSFLISTGARAGETSKLLLSDIGRLENGKFIQDITGTVRNIRHAIAKGKVKNGKKTGGGFVFFTREAREFLTIWLQVRDAHIKEADEMVKGLKSGEKPEDGEKDTRESVTRPANDQRIFAISYSSMQRKFNTLYKKVDADNKGKYGYNVTLHSTRAYFRTHAVKTMSLDLVEKILRHSGYLTTEYVKIADMEKQFHDGEHALYIRGEQHINAGELDTLRAEKAVMQKQLNALQETVEILIGRMRSENIIQNLPRVVGIKE